MIDNFDIALVEMKDFSRKDVNYDILSRANRTTTKNIYEKFIEGTVGPELRVCVCVCGGRREQARQMPRLAKNVGGKLRAVARR